MKFRVVVTCKACRTTYVGRYPMSYFPADYKEIQQLGVLCRSCFVDFITQLRQDYPYSVEVR